MKSKSGRTLEEPCSIAIQSKAMTLSAAVLFAIVAAGCGNSKHNASDWQSAFRERVQEADVLAIELCGGCEGDTEIASIRIEDRSAVQEFVALIEIQNYDGEYVALCSGRDTITFFHGDEKLAELTRIPLTALAWDDPAWQGDAVVNMDSYRRLTEWLKGQGLEYLAEELKSAEESARVQNAKNEGFVADFPPNVRSLIHRSQYTDGKINTVKALRHMASSESAFLAICRCLGRLKGSDSLWTMTDSKTQAVLSLAHAADESTFWDAVKKLSDDQNGQLGAARLFYREQIGESNLRPSDMPLLLALANRVLTDGFDQNKYQVLWHLNRRSEPEVIETLHQIVQGNVGREINPEKAWFDEPGIRFVALLGLAQCGEEISEEEWDICSTIAIRQQDRAAIELARNLISKDGEVRLEHFQFESYSLGEAGIEALSITPGPYSLGLLFDGAMNHPWASVSDKAELAVLKMIGQSWDRPGRQQKIEAWFASHPESWIKPDSVSP